MPGTTGLPHDIPYMLAADDLAGLDEFTLNLATRLASLFDQRQAGNANITPSAANTNTTKRIDFAHPYTTVPKVVVSMREPHANGVVSIWAVNADTDGFTLGVNATTTVTRDVTWMAIP